MCIYSNVAVNIIVFGSLHTHISVSSNRAKMQWSLFLLILMGQCSFFTCHLYEYHLIKERKTWQEAQTYCREKHTDLATVFNMTDMSRLSEVAGNQDRVWIGLYNDLNGTDNRKWKWSLPGVEFNKNQSMWHNEQPNDSSPENCVVMKDSNWWNVSCTWEYFFICYNEKNQSNKFYLIEDRKSWPKAQRYCRENHTDLVSGLIQLRDFEQTSKLNITLWYWIGLFRDNWRWSDGSSFSFRHWDHNSAHNDPGNKKCVMTMLGEKGGGWKHDDCGNLNPFICYDDKVILIKENKTWAEALYYCRENYNDLVSITDLAEQRWVQERAKNASTPYVWLGLRYTCTLEFWFWISDERVSYEYWASDGKMDDCDMSAAMERGGEHKWLKKDDNSRFNFICTLK